MNRAALIILLSLLSCQTATQITVKLRGIGLTCAAEDPPSVRETALTAKDRVDAMIAPSVVGQLCGPSNDPGAAAGDTDLGDVVLIPAEDGSAVEVLAVAAVSLPERPAIAAETCVERYLDDACGEAGCDTCVFARRSLAFVENSKLEVRIEFEASCVGVICDTSETCSKGTCISAETICPTEDCVLGPNGGGDSGAGGSGAGASGAGASGAGASGAGGSGAGASGAGGGSVDWELQSPTPTFNLLGVTSNGDFKLHIAAGSTLEVLSSQAPITYDPGTPNAFRALATKDVSVLAYGDAGLYSTSNNFMSPVLFLGPAEVGLRWDIAFAGGPQPYYLKETTSVVDGTNADAAGPVVNPVGGALFTAFGQGSQFAFGAYNTPLSGPGTIPVLFPAGGPPVTVPTPGPGVWDWSLWAFADGLDYWAIGVGGSTDRIFVVRCASGLACGGERADLPPPSRDVRAIWGVQDPSGSARVFFAGVDWVGHALFDPAADPKFAELVVTEGPMGNALTSIWVGPALNAEITVYVGGTTGVYAALVSQLPNLD